MQESAGYNTLLATVELVQEFDNDFSVAGALRFYVIFRGDTLSSNDFVEITAFAIVKVDRRVE